MFQMLKNKNNPLPASMPHKGISGDISDTAQKIGRDWFEAAIKRDIPRKKDQDSHISQPSVDEKNESQE